MGTDGAGAGAAVKLAAVDLEIAPVGRALESGGHGRSAETGNVLQAAVGTLAGYPGLGAVARIGAANELRVRCTGVQICADERASAGDLANFQVANAAAAIGRSRRCADRLLVAAEVDVLTVAGELEAAFMAIDRDAGEGQAGRHAHREQLSPRSSDGHRKILGVGHRHTPSGRPRCVGRDGLTRPYGPGS